MFWGNYLRTTAGASQEAKAKTPYTIPLLEYYESLFPFDDINIVFIHDAIAGFKKKKKEEPKPTMLVRKMVKMSS